MDINGFSAVARKISPNLVASQRSNFFYSFSFLPRAQREAMHRIYDFCRYTDDLVDEGEATISEEEKRARLNEWREEVKACYTGAPSHPILLALQGAINLFEIPQEYLLTLVDGVEMDLTKNRYTTFEELQQYCYAVASVVGLISIQVFGYKEEETREYAINLGYALQLTNILRDVPVDAAKGRIYLPQADLRQFSYTDEDVFHKRYDRRFVELMKFEASRAKGFYSTAHSFLRKEDQARMFPAEIMDAVYFRLLNKIEQAEYNVFDRRITVSTPHKLAIALKFWMNHHFIHAK